MLKRSRVGTTMDVGRFGAALARPGMDTRLWASLASVEAIVIDQKEGPIVDITLMPSGDKETARGGSGFAGAGYGFYAPMQVGDLVLVVAPSGDPDGELVVVSRVWCGSDAPPPEAAAHPNDVALRAQDGTNVRLVASGAGFIAANAPKVALGDEGATEQLVLGTTYRNNQTTLDNAWQTMFTALNTFTVALGVWNAAITAASTAGTLTTPGTLTAPGGVVATATTAFESAIIAIQLAMTHFEAASPTYLSNVSVTK